LPGDDEIMVPSNLMIKAEHLPSNRISTNYFHRCGATDGVGFLTVLNYCVFVLAKKDSANLGKEHF
jgi:hypothetical protein